MPPNTVSVARPGKRGNPFKVGIDGTQAECVALFRHDIEIAISAPIVGARIRKLIEELRGKNVACFCRLDEPCHGDVWLELANPRPMQQSPLFDGAEAFNDYLAGGEPRSEETTFYCRCCERALPQFKPFEHRFCNERCAREYALKERNSCPQMKGKQG